MESRSKSELVFKNMDRLPAEVVPVLSEHIATLAATLGEKLVGVYVHGSAAMGGFNPKQSDLDYLALVSAPLNAREREALSETFLELHGKSGFRKGVEMSIVEERFTGKEFRYPTPYQFHMGTPDQIRHHGIPCESEYVDPDLASHFTVTRERGICAYGKNIEDVFEPVDRRYFIHSNLVDIQGAREQILNDPVCVILNLCRTLCGLRDDSIYSKKEGGEKYLCQAGSYRDLVLKAVSDYDTGQCSTYDPNESFHFADETLSEIQRIAFKSD